MEVDEPGRDDPVCGIDNAPRLGVREWSARDEDDPIGGDRDVGPEALRARAVDDHAVPDQEVVGLAAGDGDLGRRAAAESCYS